MKTKTTSLLFFLLAICLISASIANAQALTVTTNKDFYSPGETIIVSGTAVANADVTVQLLNPNGQLVDIDYVRAETDGTYTLTFRIPATMPTGQWIFGTYTVKAFMGAQTATKTITIQQMVAVTGKVVDSTGAAISGATVTIDTATATTAADGTFTIYLSAPGTYTIKITKANYYTYTESITATTGTNNMGNITLTSYEDKISELENTIASLTATIQQLQTQLNTANLNISSLKTTIQQLQGTIQQLQGLIGEVSSLRSSLSSATSEISSLKSQVSELSSKLSSVTSDVSSLKTTVQQLQSSLNSANAEISSLKTTVAMATDLKSSVDALQSTVNSLKSSVDALQASTSQLPILYALAFVGIIIAIIAVILVYRKIAT